MSRRVVVHPDYLDRTPHDWAAWSVLAGPAVALSRTSSTRLVNFEGISFHLKRYRYPATVALRAALRHTLVRPSRAAHEFRMLAVFRGRAQASPPPVAYGEHRVVGFLREAFVASETVPGATSLSEARAPDSNRAGALALALSRIHRSGLVHGRLFARNVLEVVEGGILLVDLAHARCGRPGSLPPMARRARDLAFLEASLPGARGSDRARLLEAYLDGTGEAHRTEEWLAALDRFKGEAWERLRRRHRDRS